MNEYLVAILKICIVSIVGIPLSACQHKPMAFTEIVIGEAKDGLSDKAVVAQIENLLIERDFVRLGSDGYSEITGASGPIDYSSDKFVVSVVKNAGQVVVGVYEEADDFSESGVVLISDLVEVIKSWRPDAQVKVRKITPKEDAQ